MICRLQLWRFVSSDSISCYVCPYFRDGKNRPGSGNFVRCSLCQRLAFRLGRVCTFHLYLSALTKKAAPTTATPTSAATAVLAFQFTGCEYQPPAGDQTCLGYLNLGQSFAPIHYQCVYKRGVCESVEESRTGSCHDYLHRD